MIKANFFLSTLLILLFNTQFSSGADYLYEFDGLDDHGIATYTQHKMRSLGNTLTGKIIKLPALYTNKNNEFRATWIATINNIHYPSRLPKGEAHTLDELKKEWTTTLDELIALNLNTVIFQVSPMLDALYHSNHRPWSHFISGQQGLAPIWADSFDLIAWMIDESHIRGLEFHAWFNPYRVTHRKQANGQKEDEIAMLGIENFARKNPQTVYLFAEKLFLDPGHPLVLEHISNVITEFLARYDVDAIHLDDYFYPYDAHRPFLPPLRFKDLLVDRETFRTYHRSFKFVDDISTPDQLAQYNNNADLWRINNNDLMIIELKNVIDHHNSQEKRSVALGISPFGIWEHNTNSRRGSKTPISSISSLSGIYADTLKWSQNELIDYIIPQIYWEFSQKAAPYGELVTWWQKSLKKSRTHLYIGHADYKHLSASSSKAWLNYQEIANQLRYNQNYPKIKGSAFFGYSNIITSNNPNSNEAITAQNKHIELLKTNYLSTKSLVPAKPWLNHQAPSLPPSIKIAVENNLLTITFDDPINSSSRFYVIYQTSGKHSTIIEVVGRNKNKVGQNIVLSLAPDNRFDSLELAVQNRSGVVSKPITLNYQNRY